MQLINDLSEKLTYCVQALEYCTTVEITDS